VIPNFSSETEHAVLEMFYPKLNCSQKFNGNFDECKEREESCTDSLNHSSNSAQNMINNEDQHLYDLSTSKDNLVAEPDEGIVLNDQSDSQSLDKSLDLSKVPVNLTETGIEMKSNPVSSVPFVGLLDIRSCEGTARQVIVRLREYPDHFKSELGTLLNPHVEIPEETEEIDDTLIEEVSACIEGAEYVRRSMFFRPSRSPNALKFFRNVRTIIHLHCENGLSLTEV
jgi:hypothetical protein